MILTNNRKGHVLITASVNRLVFSAHDGVGKCEIF